MGVYIIWWSKIETFIEKFHLTMDLSGSIRFITEIKLPCMIAHYVT